MTKQALEIIIEHLLNYWPEHGRFIDKMKNSFFEKEMTHHLAHSIYQLVNGDIDPLVKGYRWMCEMMLEEELYFRRNGTYRLSSFSQTDALVYQNAELMTRYMDGLLLSQVLWPNHLKVFDFYRHEFLVAVKTAKRHLEVGPGHGLLLHYTAQALKASLEGWDISPSSLEKTAACLRNLGSDARVKLVSRDITVPHSDDLQCFDSLVISEVLEHLEDPASALHSLCMHALPDAKIFINVPVNSPSIDHIFLFKTPEEVIELIESVGLKIENTCLAPASGLSEVAARKAKTTISCAVIASVPVY